MIALGLCSLTGSFLAGMPVTGSFTRTALNNACNVKTPLGGLFTVLFVLSALGLLTQTFYFIPKCVLAGVIIMAVLSMIEFDLIYQIWRTKRGLMRHLRKLQHCLSSNCSIFKAWTSFPFYPPWLHAWSLAWTTALSWASS